MSTKFTSQINGHDLYAKRAEATRSGVNLETFTVGSGEGAVTTLGILPAGITTPTEAEDIANTLATQKYVQDYMSVADAMVFKGVVDGTHALPTAGYSAGWTYKVAADGTYAGQVCEVGDMIIANKDYASGTASNADWDVIQTNIDGAVVGPASVTADANIALFNGTTGKVIKDSGITIETTLTASSDAKVPTSKAVNTAITGAVNALDAEVTSDDGTNVQVKVTEEDGVVTAVNITTDNTINATDLSNAINALDVADLVQDSSGNMAGKTLKTLSETDGEISATFQDIAIVSTQVTDRQTTTFDGTAGTLVTGQSVKAAIDALDVSNITGFGKDQTLATLTETDGKIAATFQSIEIVSSAVTDKMATYDGSGTDSTKVITGAGVKDAIDGLDATVSYNQNGVSVSVTETDGKLTAVSASVAQATDNGATPGTVTYGTIDL